MAVECLPHLTKRTQFLALRDHGSTLVLPHAIIQYAALKDLPSGFIKHDNVSKQSMEGKTLSYIGFTVTRKIGNAVIRNRVKRRLRAVVRTTFITHAAPNYAYVIIGRPLAIKMQFSAMQHQTIKALRKVVSE